MIYSAVLALWLLACRNPPPPIAEGALSRAPSEPPSYLTEQIPSAPAVGRLREGLCSGDAALRTQIAENVPQDALAYTALLSFSCADEGFCAWAADQAERGGSSSPFFLSLSACRGARHDDLVAKLAPDGIVLARALDGAPFTPRLREIALQQIRSAHERPDLEGAAWFAIAALAASEGPEGARALAEALSAAGEELGPSILSALRSARGPQARALLAEACRRVDDPICSIPPIDPLTDLPSAMASGFDPEDLLEEHPDHSQAALDALLRCPDLATPEEGRRCVLALARRDRALGRLAAEKLPEDVGGDLVRLLQLSPLQLREALAEMGLQTPEDPSALTVPELLLRAHAGVRISEHLEATATGETDHTRLMYALARKARLDGFLFEQRTPAPEAYALVPPGGRVLQTTLLAWADGWRWRMLATDGDTSAAIAFINALLSERGREERFVISDGVALLGSEGQLSELAASGLCRFEPVPVSLLSGTDLLPVEATP